MNPLLLALTEPDMIEAVAKKTAEFINMSKSDERWVTPSEYCKYWKVSKMHLHRHKEFFRRNEAVVGKGKTIRFDKFFCPQTGRWKYS